MVTTVKLSKLLHSCLPIAQCPFSDLVFSGSASSSSEVLPSERICMRFPKPSPPLKLFTCASQVSRTVGEAAV